MPFQASASVTLVGPVDEEPTASHAVVERQETLTSPLEDWPGLAVVWVVQLLPSQTSASVLAVPLLENFPTASHEVGDVQEIPLSWLVAAPAGTGVV